MSVAIGLPFANEPRKGSKIEIDGILVCADTKIVASDNATTHGTKMVVSVTPSSRATIIANAAEDAHAANMLAGEITSAICGAKSPNLEPVIKEKMQTWHSAYGGGAVPGMQFVVAVAMDGDCSLFYCSPPNTVLRKFQPFAIGTGSRAIEPLLPDEISPLWKLEPTILRAAYWMYRAKRDEGTFVGGKTDASVINKVGSFAFLEHNEMEKAENISREVDNLFDVVSLGLFSRESKKNRRTFLAGFSKLYMELSTKINDIKFDSLEFIDKLHKLRQRRRS